MGKIIARVQTRQAYAALRRAGYSLRSYGPGLPVPPEIERLWGVGIAELRQPEEKAKNEAMRQRMENLPPVGDVLPLAGLNRPDRNCPDCKGRVHYCGGSLCGFVSDLSMSKQP